MKRARFSNSADGDTPYFAAYSDIRIHEEMISDQARTFAYKRAIDAAGMKDKTVLDVGAGTGILSIFCAKAGAKRVYAVEASDIAHQAMLNVQRNKVNHIVHILHCKVEDAVIPEKVDFIISEWMGYALLYESMLESVIIARDCHLKPEGTILPHSARIFLCPFTDEESLEMKRQFWTEKCQELYGVDLSAMVKMAERSFTQEVQLRYLEDQSCISHPACVQTINLCTIAADALKVATGAFDFSIHGNCFLSGFAVWFDVEFSKEITLSTSPSSQETHWMQSLFYLPEQVHVEQDHHLRGKITFSQQERYRRFLDIRLEFAHQEEEMTLTFSMHDQ